MLENVDGLEGMRFLSTIYSISSPLELPYQRQVEPGSAKLIISLALARI